MREIKFKKYTVKRLRKLARNVMEPWLEIHGLILNLDGSHNRIMGKGIKSHSIEVYDAINELADEIENDTNTT